MRDSQKRGKSQGAPLREQIETQPTRRTYSIDLRVHNPSFGGYAGIDGIDPARALVSLARVKGIDILAISDFYTTEFAERVQLARGNQSTVIIPAVDVRCRVGGCEDIVLSCLFPEESGIPVVVDLLKQLGVPRSAAGSDRYIVTHPPERIIALTEERNGSVLPIRLDKTPLRAQAIPELVERHGFRAFDLAYPESARYFATRWPEEKFHLFNFSNAYALAQVGTRSVRIKLSSPGFDGIRGLLARSEGIAEREVPMMSRPEKRTR